MVTLPMTGARHDKLIGIQFGRAVAAMLVVFYHGGRMLPQYLGDMSFAQYFKFGNAGVDFFFVLSGFIIYYVHHSDINHPSRLDRYVFRRLTRIYPIYWVVTLLGVALLVAKMDWAELAPVHVIASFLLIPHAQEPVVGVAWTLSHEMLFYSVFAVLICSRALGVLLVGLWALVVVLGSAIPNGSGFIQFVGDPYHIEFALGVFAAYLARSHPIRTAPVLAALGVIAFLIVGMEFNAVALEHKFLGRLMYGMSSTLIIYGLAVWEARGSIVFPKWSAYLGAASYSIYLIHTFLLGWFGRAVSKVVAPGTASSVLYVAVAVGAVAGGCALYQFVERPLQDMIRRGPSLFSRASAYRNS
jgi:peptidoglycan/LPS O-acetylase OafA/YrhL